jgi:hypothetical protein
MRGLFVEVREFTPDSLDGTISILPRICTGRGDWERIRAAGCRHPGVRPPHADHLSSVDSICPAGGGDRPHRLPEADVQLQTLLALFRRRLAEVPDGNSYEFASDKGTRPSQIDPYIQRYHPSSGDPASVGASKATFINPQQSRSGPIRPEVGVPGTSLCYSRGQFRGVLIGSADAMLRTRNKARAI